MISLFKKPGAQKPTSFKPFKLPTGESVYIPEDLELKFPDLSVLENEKIHFLVYIPWNDRYLIHIGKEYQDFFNKVLPYLRSRTTDVHSALCFPFVKELIASIGKEVDEKVISIAFILHDSGWGQITDEEIADSLGVEGLTLTKKAFKPKELHTILGENIAKKVLEEYPFTPPLTIHQKEQIYTIIRTHDKPWELKDNEEKGLEARIVADADHLWSFTHENFWQDTVRKGVDPVTYRINLANDLEDYFVTGEAKAKAKLLLENRQEEVEEWRNYR